jgi:hypothetical protein
MFVMTGANGRLGRLVASMLAKLGFAGQGAIRWTGRVSAAPLPDRRMPLPALGGNRAPQIHDGEKCDRIFG